MSTEPNNDTNANTASHAGLLNWPSALMLVLWLLVILGVSGIETFSVLSSPAVLGVILAAAVGVTIWSALRFFKSRDKNA